MFAAPLRGRCGELARRKRGDSIGLLDADDLLIVARDEPKIRTTPRGRIAREKMNAPRDAVADGYPIRLGTVRDVRPLPTKAREAAVQESEGYVAERREKRGDQDAGRRIEPVDRDRGHRRKWLSEGIRPGGSFDTRLLPQRRQSPPAQQHGCAAHHSAPAAASSGVAKV